MQRVQVETTDIAVDANILGCVRFTTLGARVLGHGTCAVST